MTFEAGRTSGCGEVFWKGLTNPKQNRVSKFLETHEGRDRFVKALRAVIAVFVEIIVHANVDEKTKQGAHTFHQGFKDARDVFGIFNAITAIPRVIQAAKNFFTIGHHFFEDTDYVGGSAPSKETLSKRGKFRESHFEGDFRVVGTRGQKVLAWIKEGSEVIATSSFTVAFGPIKLIKLVDKHFPHLVSQSAKSIGGKFAVVMTVNHLATVTGSIADLVRAGIVFKHIDKHNRTQDDLLDFYRQITKSTLKLVEKGLELGSDVIVLFKLPAPPAVKLTLDVAVAGLGLYNVWQATAAPAA